MPGNQTALDFAHAARTLVREARRRGLVAPSFRCPPRLAGVQRSVRRHVRGVVVSVQVKGRPWPAVLGDMIEGVIVTNLLAAPDADRVRTELWAALDDVLSGPAHTPSPSVRHLAPVAEPRGVDVSATKVA